MLEFSPVASSFLPVNLNQVRKSTGTIICAILLLSAVSCQSDTMADLDDEKCEESGGKVVYGIIGEVCAMPTSDAGKACNDISECEGLCMSNGKCSEWDNNFGCTDVRVDGEILTICID